MTETMVMMEKGHKGMVMVKGLLMEKVGMVKARERLRKGAVHTLLDQREPCHKMTEIPKKMRL